MRLRVLQSDDRCDFCIFFSVPVALVVGTSRRVVPVSVDAPVFVCMPLSAERKYGMLIRASRLHEKRKMEIRANIR